MLPKAAQAVLEQRFVRATSSLEACQRSADGTTTKLLVRLQDGLQVEAVVMTYSHPGALFAAPSLLSLESGSFVLFMLSAAHITGRLVQPPTLTRLAGGLLELGVSAASNKCSGRCLVPS